jgi:DNA-binding NtrC family response regulator
MAGTPINVLVVEDDISDTDLIMRELRRGGYEPEFTRVETEGQMRAALDRQAWDVAIVDHSLPSFDAPSALAIWKELGIDQPFIILSDVIEVELAILLMKAGVHDFVRKFDLSRLVPAIQREVREAAIRREKRQVEHQLRGRIRELEAEVERLTAELARARGS